MRVRCLVTIFAITILSGLVGAQSPAAERLTFEVASIKRNVSGDQGSQIRVQPGGQIVVTNNSLFNLIRNAYGTQRFEMVPGPQLRARQRVANVVPPESEHRDALVQRERGVFELRQCGHVSFPNEMTGYGKR